MTRPFSNHQSGAGVLLLGFGGPDTPEDVRPFLASVAGNRPVPREGVEEMVRRYEAIGGASPFLRLTMQQAGGVEAVLKEKGLPLPVYVATVHWKPSIPDVLARMARDGVRRAVGVVLAPHRTGAGSDRYVRALENARAANPAWPPVECVGSWHDHPLFIRAQAEQVSLARASLPEDRRAAAVWIYTAHSVPQPAGRSSGYAGQVARSAGLVSELLKHQNWRV